MKILDDHQLYAEKYFDGFYSESKYLAKLREKQYAQERARLLQHAPNGGEILDIGCGTGAFLAGLDDRWKKYGFEVSEHAGRIAAGRGIYVVAPGINTNVLFPDLSAFFCNSMDVVIMRGVLQHISTPMEYLAQVTRILKPGGLLAILATPNTDGIVYSLWKNLPPLDPHRNWVLFGKRMLENILGRMGYRQLVWHFPYWKTPYARPIKDFVKFGASLILGYHWKFAFPGSMMEIFAVKGGKDV